MVHTITILLLCMKSEQTPKHKSTDWDECGDSTFS